MAAARERISKKEDGGKTRKEDEEKMKEKEKKTFRKLFGFELSDFSSPSAFVKLLNRPTDPASLGILRVVYGMLMLIDIPQERGMAFADRKYGNPSLCRFPLFNFLHPLPVEWMYMVYLVLMFGAFGIMLGFMFRISCVMFAIPYWYLFFLDKTVWNNHSYLYGLISILLMVSDANRYWSIDGLLFPEKRNTHIPLWNYTLFRTQIFFVYFMAGIKKLEKDWMMGHSMRLSHQWVFAPFKLLLTNDQIDFFLVHVCGWFLDMFGGFLLFFDYTRPLAAFFISMFHAMNSQMFSIGMFPYTMFFSTTIFFYADWPRKLCRKLPPILRMITPLDTDLQPSSHCIYNKEDIKPEDTQNKTVAVSKQKPPTSATRYHKMATIFVILYICEQSFLPYSHFITQGYNNWTQGLYGYSWDMMVHSWSTQHLRITYKNLDTGEIGYLDPSSWVISRSKRWSSHADMAKQYATCIAERLKHYALPNVAIYFDVWKSVNKRFQQRLFDPRVDILRAPWSPFRFSSFVMPLLVDLSDWRGKLKEMRKEIRETSNETDIIFVADFPGLYLENYIQPDLGNASITVLQGEIKVEIESQKKNYTLKSGQKTQLPPGEFHKVHTVSDSPSCYMYIYVNTTMNDIKKKYTEYRKLINETEHGIDRAKELSEFAKDPNLLEYKKQLQAEKMKKEKQKTDIPLIRKLKRFVSKKYRMFTRTFSFVAAAIRSIVTGSSFEEFMWATYRAEKNQMNEMKRMEAETGSTELPKEAEMARDELPKESEMARDELPKEPEMARDELPKEGEMARDERPKE